MVVGIGPPFGVDKEYRCQPGSILPVKRASTALPGDTARSSNFRVHCTGSCAANAETTNAKKAIAKRITSVRLRYGTLGLAPPPQFFLDPFVDLDMGEFRRHANGVLDGIGIGTAVG